MTDDSVSDGPILSLDEVSVRFGARSALTKISIELLPSHTYVALGTNGAGKTTLLRIIAGALQPTSGRIARTGTPIRSHVALVAQAVALYPFLTVRENCLAAGRIIGVRGNSLAAKAEAAMDRTLCSGVEDELVARLSGGFQRRAAIATALMGDAPLVILDEPTTGLDVEATEAISVIVRGLTSMGTTIVIATHDFGLADTTADFALFLRDGRLLAMDAPRKLCRQLFPDKKHVEIALSEEPSAQQVEVFVALNADRRSARRWSLFSDLDAQHQPTILQRLHDAEFKIQEALIREPGVAALFERFCLDRGAP